MIKIKVSDLMTELGDRAKEFFPGLDLATMSDMDYCRNAYSFSPDRFIEGEKAAIGVISTATPDRDGDVVLPEGMDGKDYMAHPVVLANHDYKSLPIGKCNQISRQGKGLVAKTTFAPHEKAQDYYSYLKAGFPLAYSIGFIPQDSVAKGHPEFAGELAKCRDKGYVDEAGAAKVKTIHRKWKLLEYSAVAVPANQEALNVAVSKGLVPATTVIAEIDGKKIADGIAKASANGTLKIPGAGSGDAPNVEKALTHNSKLADKEPSWGGVDKTKLPDNAFADSTNRAYPHHWVSGGSATNDDGRYTDGTMYLHRGGLGAARAAANGARSGKEASADVKAHLNAHAKAIGSDGKKSLIKKALSPDGKPSLFAIMDAIRNALQASRPDKLGVETDGDGDEYAYLNDIYPNADFVTGECVVAVYDNGSAAEYHLFDYAVSDGAASLTNPREVEPKYVPVEEDEEGAGAEPDNTMMEMGKAFLDWMQTKSGRRISEATAKEICGHLDGIRDAAKTITKCHKGISDFIAKGRGEGGGTYDGEPIGAPQPVSADLQTEPTLKIKGGSEPKAEPKVIINTEMLMTALKEIIPAAIKANAEVTRNEMKKIANDVLAQATGRVTIRQ